MKRKIFILIVVILLMLVTFISVKYNIEQSKAVDRFKKYQDKAKTIQTTYGKLSYIDEGEGNVILSCHGICGGYDQAYDSLSEKTNIYRIIAPSRFGYPGSDVPANPSVNNQIEAYIELLDSLHIDKVYVFGTSAGGTFAIKFALTHPERTKGLILFCSGYPAVDKPEKKATYAGPPSAMCYDLPMWLFSPLLKPIMGMESDTIRKIMPLGARHDGIVLDAKIANTDMDNCYEKYDMSKLSMPVLIVHAEDDKLADYNKAKVWSLRIPNCTFVSFKTGGHLMKGHSKEINVALDEFISNCNLCEAY
jgi:pimeloyl-ACP methyl ester carboxylesterase